MKHYYIIKTEEHQKHTSIVLKKSDYKKIFDNSSSLENKIFILDQKNNKLYGYYKVDMDNKKEDEHYYTLKISAGNYRRGIYYKAKNSSRIIKINADEYKKLKRKLDALNNQLPATFFSYSIKNNMFKYQIIETSKSLYVAYYEKEFDKNAFHNIKTEYEKLISIPSNENNSKYRDIGNALMNMLISEKSVIDFLLSKPRIVYLSEALNNVNNKEKINIPFEILYYKENFLSQNIIFSYTHAINIIPKNEDRKDKVKLALISIPNSDLINAENEVRIISEYKSEYVRIDIFRKSVNYLELINILEEYDVVHIITHGKTSGIMLSDNCLLKHLPSLTNPPSLIFMNVCNSESDDNKLVHSIVASGVPYCYIWCW